MNELFVALRCEELAADMVRPALEGLRRAVLELISGVDHGEVRVYSTPRRLAVAVDQVAPARPVVDKLVTGPPADRAFVDGEPTRAALGFARGRGVDVSELEVVDGPRGPVVAARVREGGERVVDLVTAGIEGAILGLPFAKSMEWGEGGPRFGRPLHGVAVLYDGEALAGEVAGLPLTPSTLGHRLADETAFGFRSCAEWLAGLRARQVEPDLEVRAGRIRALLDEASERLGADRIDVPELAEEVLHLVEWPVLVLASFDEDLLHLPPRLLVESMTVHQRYFPVHRGGELTHHFAVISNNPWADEALVATGNARVIRARFHDAKFFFAEDKKLGLEEHGEELQRMRWIRGLGTMADKQARVADLAGALAGRVGAEPAHARRAGALCKCDLMTQMVGEFPELQGHMGRLYALHQGEPEAVAQAIEEHYRPRGADDEVARSPAGIAVALAERLDTLVGCFGIGMTPKGGGDPQGLRRAALGLVNTLVRREIRADLADLYREAAGVFHARVVAGPEGYEAWTRARGTDAAPSGLDELVGALVGFTLARVKAQAVGDGCSADLVDAVVAASPSDGLVLDRKLAALRRVAGTADFLPIMTTFKRVLNITRDADHPEPPRAALTHDAERALFDAVAGVDDAISAAAAELDFDAALGHVLTLREPVAHLFDEVLVEDPDPAVRAVRLGLLLRVSRAFLHVADFSLVSTR